MIAGTQAPQGGPSGECQASRLPLRASPAFLKWRTGGLAARPHSSEQQMWVKRPQGPEHH